MKHRQSGHTLLIIIIVVISLGILGLLGFLFWQNFINTPGTAATITNFEQCKAAASSKILETYPEQCVTSDGRTFVGPTASGETYKTYCTIAEKLCFEYLSDWKVELLAAASDEPGASVDNLRISSADGEFWLLLTSGISGLGGTCPEESRKDVYVLESTPIPGLTGYQDDYNQNMAAVSRTIYQTEDGEYVAALYATTSPEYAKAGTLQTCGTAFSEFIKGTHSVISSDFEGAGVFRFGYTGSDFYGDSAVTYKTVDEARAVYATDNYTRAGQVLASLRYE
ncbi:MAG: hypothetical protein WAV04_03670 [Candidatus Microsaccharimonas sp.]|jgi:hypothetical protein